MRRPLCPRAVGPCSVAHAVCWKFCSSGYIANGRRIGHSIHCHSTQGRDSLMCGVDTLVDCILEDPEKGCRAIDTWIEDNDVTLRVLEYIEECVMGCEDGERRHALDSIGERLTAHLLGVDVRRPMREISGEAQPLSGEPLDTIVSGGLQLSTQGMQLLEQQAAALEATMGIQKAESIVQILGRKRVSDEDTIAVPENGDAWRILQVLVQVQDRMERKDMLLEAFVPVDEDEEYDEFGEDEALFTTPFALIQVVQKCMASESELERLCEDTSLDRSSLPHNVLEELRADIMESIDGHVSC